MTAAILLHPAAALADNGEGGTIFDPTQGADGPGYSSTGMTIEEFEEWFWERWEKAGSNNSSSSNSNNSNASNSKPQSSLASLEKLNGEVKGLGEYVQKGMEKRQYERAAEREWEAAGAEGDPAKPGVQLTGAYGCAEIEQAIIGLGKYPDAQLSILGETEEGTPIYVLEIAAEDAERQYILGAAGLAGGDVAGTLFLLKQAAEILEDGAPDGYAYSFVFSANPDQLKNALGMEETSHADSEGIDPTISFPTEFAGFIPAGGENSFGAEPGEARYLGDNLGDSACTRALISWVEKRIDRAALFINYAGSDLTIVSPDRKEPRFHSAALARFNGRSGKAYARSVEAPEEGSLAAYVDQLARGYEFDARSGRLKQSEGTAPRNAGLEIFTIGVGGPGHEAYTRENRAAWIDLYYNNGFKNMFLDLAEVHGKIM